MGQYCELCRPGSYGNATDQTLGCQECQCNGHGDAAAGTCDNVTGICYCTENSKGDHCEECVAGFYHDHRWAGRPKPAITELSRRNYLLSNFGRCSTVLQRTTQMQYMAGTLHLPSKNTLR